MSFAENKLKKRCPYEKEYHTSEEELADIQIAFGYKDTARKLDVLTLINYLVCVSVNEFKSYRHCADVGVQYGLPIQLSQRRQVTWTTKHEKTF